jgi:hypothetical protein
VPTDRRRSPNSEDYRDLKAALTCVIFVLVVAAVIVKWRWW